MTVPPTPILPPAGSKVPAVAVANLPDGSTLEIQVNFCKNIECKNFGVAPSLAKGAHRSKAPPEARGIEYILDGARGPSKTTKSTVQLRCQLCGESPPIKNNEGLARDLERIAEYTKAKKPVSCPDISCINHGKPFARARYLSWGKNSQGSQRWKCRACGKTFAEPQRTTIRQRVPEKNVLIYQLLVNKSPIKRICEVAAIAPKTFYDRLDFLHERSLAFAGKFDRLLPTLALDRLYLAVDRQDYVLNWAARKDKRNATLNALGTADLTSGFVFGMHLNFDSRLDREEIEADAVAVGDPGKAPPYRKYSWLILERDYDANTAEAARRKSARGVPVSLADDIAATYAETGGRADVEETTTLSKEQKLPAKGMQVRADYTLYAHFLWLKVLLRNVGKVRFYLDQESGIRAACLSAFAPEIQAGRCDAFYARLGKEMTVDEKRRVKRAAEGRFQEFSDANPSLSADEVKVEMMKEEIRKASTFGKWSDRWAVHPWPDSAEPEKALCYLTNRNDFDEDHLARLYLKGSLHAIDRFFMLLRRRVAMLERSIATASKAGRSWHGYSAYNPTTVQKTLDIFRTYYNFCLVGKDKKTPAMRLGLAERPYTPSDILF